MLVELLVALHALGGGEDDPADLEVVGLDIAGPHRTLSETAFGACHGVRDELLSCWLVTATQGKGRGSINTADGTIFGPSAAIPDPVRDRRLFSRFSRGRDPRRRPRSGPPPVGVRSNAPHVGHNLFLLLLLLFLPAPSSPCCRSRQTLCISRAAGVIIHCSSPHSHPWHRLSSTSSDPRGMSLG